MDAAAKPRRRRRTVSGYKVKSKALKWIWAVLRTVLLIGLAYIILYPVLVKLSVGLMSRSDMNDMTVHWVPKNPSLDNFKEVLRLIDYGEYFFTTLFTTVATTLLQVAACTFAGYGFARFHFKGRNFLFFLAILTLVVPQQAYSVSSYTMFRNFDFFGIGGLFGWDMGSLLNTPWPAMILAIGCQGTKNGLLIYIMRNFFQNLPKEVEESAWVDGAGVFRTFTRIMLPNTVPALTTITVFSFVWSWNDLYFASTYAPNMKLMPLILNQLSWQIQQILGRSNVDVIQISMLTNAAALLILLPLLIFFLIVQRFFIEGVERTGLTGM